MRYFLSLLTISILAALSAVSATPASLYADSEDSGSLAIPMMIFAGVPFEAHADSLWRGASLKATGRDSETVIDTVIGDRGLVLLGFRSFGNYKIHVSQNNRTIVQNVRVWPGWLTILPPLLAILLALAFRQVLPALFLGIWVGATIVQGMNPWTGIARLIDTYLVEAMTDPDHVRIIIFSMTLGGMVGLITRSGGAIGLVDMLSRLAVSRRMSQFSTWLIGLLIFFDDYSNTLMVGNTMRPFTDKMKVSREKLSYIVDSTAAPVASIALISTWIGYELALLSAAIDSLGLEESAYWMFLKALPFSFYSWACMLFVLIIVLSGRDFGPMLKAETRALKTGRLIASEAQPLLDEEMQRLEPPTNAPHRWYNALAPIGVMSIVLMIGLYRSGQSAVAVSGAAPTIYNIIGAADPFQVLLWAAFAGVFSSLALIFIQRLLNVREAMDAFLVGFKSLILAMVILTMARVIQIVCTELQTATYLLTVTRHMLSPGMLPALTFVLAAFTSFSTGTSWGTMAILMPLIIPLAYHLPIDAGLDLAAVELTMVGTIGAILSGAVFGDHCSPISDTTIMSSMSSGSDHIDHVRTQLPYSLTVGVAAVTLGYIPAGYGLINPWLSNLVVVLVLLLVVRLFGRKAPFPSA
jgi:Na+/H+ antiporter NhaC